MWNWNFQGQETSEETKQIALEEQSPSVQNRTQSLQCKEYFSQWFFYDTSLSSSNFFWHLPRVLNSPTYIFPRPKSLPLFGFTFNMYSLFKRYISCNFCLPIESSFASLLILPLFSFRSETSVVETEIRKNMTQAKQVTKCALDYELMGQMLKPWVKQPLKN